MAYVGKNSVKKTSAKPRKSRRAAPSTLPLGPRRLVTNRPELIKHCLRFVPAGAKQQRNATLLAGVVISNTKEFDYWNASRNQRQTVGRGRPPRPEVTQLVSSLAGAFYLRTEGRAIWRGTSKRLWGPFEAFAAKILRDIGDIPVEWVLREHIRIREALWAKVGPQIEQLIQAGLA